MTHSDSTRPPLSLCFRYLIAAFGALLIAATEARAAEPDAAARARALDLQESEVLGESASRPGAAPAAAPTPPASPNSVQPASAPPSPPVGSKAGEGGGQAAGRVRAVYLPDSERQRIRDEVREEVLQTARRENWSQPNAIPEWVRGLQFSGDLMVRGEGDFYGSNNVSLIYNFQAINGGPPVNFQRQPPAPLFVPFVNVTEDRVMPRLRLRFGINARVSDELLVGLRLATGSAANPVSTNQTLGNGFNKFSFLVDRAYLRYTPGDDWNLTIGRGPNPFVTGVDLVWDRDLSFDGLNLQWLHEAGSRQWRAATGAFSVENTDPNYPSNAIIKLSSHDKWLWGTQLELTQQWQERYSLRGALAYYNFVNVKGEVSQPCEFVASDKVPCNSDDTRPAFVQKGNTMFALRDLIVANPSDAQFQYFGLSSAFRVGVATLSFDAGVAGPVHAALDLEYARNFAFDAVRIGQTLPVNNLSVCTSVQPSDCNQRFDGGKDAYQAQLRIGHPVVRDPWRWQATLGYRCIESDALLDAFTDSDFHVGGTNAKGFYVGGVLGFARNASLGLRYSSATEVSSAPLAIEVLQLDVNVKF